MIGIIVGVVVTLLFVFLVGVAWVQSRLIVVQRDLLLEQNVNYVRFEASVTEYKNLVNAFLQRPFFISISDEQIEKLAIRLSVPLFGQKSLIQ